MELFVAYLLRLLPGLSALGALIFLIPRRMLELRVMLYILIFILFRDTMTPLGLWELTPQVVLRLPRDSMLCVVMGLFSASFVLSIQKFEPELAKLLVWWKGEKFLAVAEGIAASLVIAVPVLLFYRTLPVSLRGSHVPAIHLGPLLFMALFGNLLEEALFRGYLQGLIEKYSSPLRAAIVAGVFFAGCHAFLATTVTALGAPVIAFTLYEGLLAAFVRMRRGVISSTLAHGGAIFILASGRGVF